VSLYLNPEIAGMNRFGLDSFFLRFIVAAVVVFATYNAEGFSYFHWILNNLGSLNLYMAAGAVILVLSWIMLIRASIISLSLIGFSLITVAFALLAWYIIHQLGLNASSKGAIIYIIELAIALVLSVGVPWSNIKRKFSRQPKTDQAIEVEEHTHSQAANVDQSVADDRSNNTTPAATTVVLTKDEPE